MKVLVLPSHVSLTIDVGADERCTFAYRETFAAEHAAAVARTAEAIENAIANGVMPKGITLRQEGNLALVFEGHRVRREDLGNMMFGEFMLWASIADTSLRDFVATAMFAGRATAKAKVSE